MVIFQRKNALLYVDEFLAEGVIDGRLVMLPIAKSTELLFLNKTIFDRFAADTGVSEEELLHFESLFALSLPILRLVRRRRDVPN